MKGMAVSSSMEGRASIRLVTRGLFCGQQACDKNITFLFLAVLLFHLFISALFLPIHRCWRINWLTSWQVSYIFMLLYLIWDTIVNSESNIFTCTVWQMLLINPLRKFATILFTCSTQNLMQIRTIIAQFSYSCHSKTAVNPNF